MQKAIQHRASNAFPVHPILDILLTLALVFKAIVHTKTDTTNISLVI